MERAKKFLFDTHFHNDHVPENLKNENGVFEGAINTVGDMYIALEIAFLEGRLKGLQEDFEFHTTSFDNSVRCVHTPTGCTAECDTYRVKYRNQKEAARMVIDQLIAGFEDSSDQYVEQIVGQE